jgi:hypothetical protein
MMFQIMMFQIAPEVFHPTEFGRVGRQERGLDVDISAIDIPAALLFRWFDR